jgi:parallel beta-helix repeat protein
LGRIRAGLVSGVWVLVLFVAVFGVVLNVPVVRGDKTIYKTIYIRADGSVDPPETPIVSVDNVTYTFIDNIITGWTLYNSYFIVVLRDNIVIDGADYTIQGLAGPENWNVNSFGTGMVLSGRSNVTVKNLTVKGFYEGIYLSGSSNCSITDNNILANRDFGIGIDGSSNNSITGNNITANRDWGIIFWGPYYGAKPSFNILSRNNITNNGFGLGLSRAYNALLRNNNMIGNGHNFAVWGYELSHFIHDIDTSNTVDGKPIHYWVNRQNEEVPSDAGYVALVNSVNITVKGLELKKNYQGILLANATNSKITNNNITNNIGYGVELSWGSSYNTISANNITNNGSGVGISLSDYNTISGNNIVNNGGYGIYLDYYSDSSNNTIYHNNFIDNPNQAVSWLKNTWDDGYPSGGNYWSDYVGVDVESGPNQDLLGSDGLGDTPYVIDENNTDYYPLMNPWSAVAGNLQILKPTNESVIMGPVNITFTIENRGCDVEFARGDSSNRIDLEIEYRSTGGELYGWGITFWSTSYDGLVLHSEDKYAQTVFYDPSEFEKAVPPDFIGDAPYGKATIRLVHWKRMDEGYGYGEFGVTEINVILIPPPLSASISPLSASILVGQSVTFTSAVSGGYTPYGYQWYLNGAPFSGATLNTWTFTPTTSGIYYVHLKVTDDKGNTAQSAAARITATTVPVGGYSFPIQVQTKAEPIIPYIALMATLTAIFIKLKPKTKRKR